MSSLWEQEEIARCKRAWEATRRPKFALRSRINAIREQYGLTEISEEEYNLLRDNYYRNHPDAKR